MLSRLVLFLCCVMCATLLCWWWMACFTVKWAAGQASEVMSEAGLVEKEVSR